MDDSGQLEMLKYPIGRFKVPDVYSPENYKTWIQIIETLPDRLKAAVEHLDDKMQNTPYRPGGWTVRQVVHHLADSHINSYCRFKLALTEEVPTIRPYHEELWAELDDGKSAPMDLSISLLAALHRRWVYFMRSMETSDWERKFLHPESKKEFHLKTILALYAWHSEHHLNHILKLKQREGWNG